MDKSAAANEKNSNIFLKWLFSFIILKFFNFMDKPRAYYQNRFTKIIIIKFLYY